MKKRILCFIAIVSILSIFLLGCSNKDDLKQNPKTSSDTQEQQDKQDDAKESQDQDRFLRYDSNYKQAAREHKKYYDKILSKYHQFLCAPTETKGLNEDIRGVLHSYTDSDVENIESLLSGIGYNLIDINSDKIPELIIGNLETQQDGYHYGSNIHALYTIVKDKAKLVFSSSPTDSYFYIGNDKFYNSYTGSGEEAATVFYIGDENGEYLYTDYYFAEPKEANSQELSYIYRKLGEPDSQISKKEYDEVLGKIKAQIKEVRFVPFYDYTEESVFEFDSIKVQAQYSTEEEIEYAYDYDGFNTEDKDAVMVTFITNDMTKDFKNIEFKECRNKRKWKNEL